ncbi:MAG: hypothetical protein ACK502_08000 [Alphaproteobacteria bacterium]
MKLVETDRFRTQKDVSGQERQKAHSLLKLYESVTPQQAKSDTTRPHITGIPDTPLKSMSLSGNRDGKHVVFGFHGDEVVMLGFIQDSHKIRNRDELFEANNTAIDLMLYDFIKYQQEHKAAKADKPEKKPISSEALRLLAQAESRSRS